MSSDFNARSTTHEAIVLRRVDYKEADRIVTLITPGLGKISVLARAVRKPASKLAGGIEPLALNKITVRAGRGELFSLVSAEMQNSWNNIIKDFDRLQFAYFAIKKINQAAENLQEDILFAILKTTLANLDDAKINLNLISAWFHANFMQAMGVGINLSRDVDGHRLSEDKNYSFSPDYMAFYENEKGDYSAGHLKFMKILHLKKPEFVAQIGGIEKVLDSSKILLENLNTS
jgi:DNA repair protein RecO (recombination protein O)